MNANKLTTAAAARRHYTSLVEAGTFTGSVAAAVRKWHTRRANRPLPPPAPGRIGAASKANTARLAHFCTIAMPTALRDRAYEEVRRMYPRWRNWCGGVQPSTYYRIVVGSTGSNSDWNKRSTFKRHALVPSYTTATRLVLTYYCYYGVHKVRAPRGWVWDADGLGHYLRRAGRAGEAAEAYHPTADEIIAGDGRAIARTARELAAKRRELAAKRRENDRRDKQAAAARARLLPLVIVTMQDARRAGNCAAGTIEWAHQRGYEYGGCEHLGGIRGDVLARIEEHDPRVTRAIDRAVERQTLVSI